jgi:hypothetical protein
MLAYWHTRFPYPQVWAVIINIEYETGAGFWFSVTFFFSHVIIFSGLYFFAKLHFAKSSYYRIVTKSDMWGRVGNWWAGGWWGLGGVMLPRPETLELKVGGTYVHLHKGKKKISLFKYVWG